MTSPASTFCLSPIAMLIAGLFTSGSAASQIIADPSAHSSERPVILRTANGLPQVDITAPTAAGVSMNRFSQFNVDPHGAILNNGRTASSTALAGWVAANPALIAQPARVIVGDVTGKLPSQLNGYIEIAGNKADLILANPAGITCNGCGFLHANRVELATGSPLWNSQRVTGYAMGRGPLQVAGRGMDARSVDAVAILTQAAQINAGLWAKDVQFTLANPADSTALPSSPSTPSSTSAPTFALDVAAIGGMYANRIFLVGTAQGLGARNVGVLQADQQLVLNLDGKLENSGTIDAAHVMLSATRIDNVARGQIFGDTITITADRVANAGHPEAAPVIASATRVDIAAREIENTDHAVLFSGGDMAMGRTLDATGHATGLAEQVTNRAATIEALGKLNLSAQRFDNLNHGVTTQEVQVGATDERWYLQPEGSAERTPLEHFRFERWSRAGQYRWLTDSSVLTDGIPGKTPLPDVDGIDCANEAGTDCTATPGSAYRADDPAWGYFQLPPPDAAPPSPGVPPTPPTLAVPQPPAPGTDPTGSLMQSYQMQKAQYDQALADYRTQQTQHDSTVQAWQQWQATTESRRSALADAISAYNERFNNIAIRRWTQYDVKHSEFETRVTSSDPGRVIAGGDMTLAGNALTNDQSQIIAGGRLTGTLENLTSIDATGTHRVHESGTSQFSKSHYHGWLNNYSTRDWGPLLPFDPADIVNTIVLPVMVTQDHASTGHAAIDVATRRLTSDGSSLFKVNPGNGPLLATDTRFTRYRDWLSSDFMIGQLQLDPTLMQKRLGDGFIEQKLVREQVAQLTGRRWLPGNADDEQQYAALMNSGVQQASALQLKPGIELSADQVRRLTSDLVWLVQQDVPLPDGSTQQVLVPQVYLRPRAGDLRGDGTLISAQSVELIVRDALTHAGMLAATDDLSIHAGRIDNSGTVTGTAVTVNADTDLVQHGGPIIATDSATLTAGRDIVIDSSTQSSTRDSSNRQGIGTASRTNLDRAASVTVSGSGPLLLGAGRDVTLNAAAITHKGTGKTTVVAGRDLQLGTVVTRSDVAGVGRRDAKNYVREGERREVGTTIDGSGDVKLAAAGDLIARAASVRSATGKVALSAGRDVTVTSGESSHEFAQGTHFTDSGLFGSTSATRRVSSSRTEATASTVSGARVNIDAGRDARFTSSEVVSDTGTSVTARRDVTIDAANATATETRYSQDTQSGLMGSGGFGVTIGTRRLTTDAATTTTTAVGSTVGSTQGDVRIAAGGKARQVGSHVLAPQGNVTIAARGVDITEARNTETTVSDTRFRQTGITVALSNPVITAVQTAQQMSEAASNTSDGRMKALAAANAAMAASNAVAAMKSAPADAKVADQLGGVQLSVSIGTSKSDSHTVVSKTDAVASTVGASGNVRITATGNETQSDVTVQGSQIAAGQQIQLTADHALNLQAASTTQAQTTSNSSASASVGVTMSLSAKPSIGFNVSGGRGKGSADGEDLSWTNTTVTAGEQVSLKSGKDTTLRGAVVTASQVTTTTGGQLVIESLQDSSSYTSSQQQIGGSVTIGPSSSANLNYAKSKVDSTYTSVNEQSGIRAGDSGFHVNVAGDTQLKGGAITSTQAAADANRNQFTSGGPLTTTDIENRANYKAQSTSVSVGTGFSAEGKLALAGTGVGFGNDSGSNASTTKAGISNVAGDKTMRTGDKETGIAKIFDADKVQKEITAQTQITQTFSTLAPKAVASYADKQINALNAKLQSETDPQKRAELTTEMNRWAEGGTYRVLVHTATGALVGNLEGAAGAGVAAAAAPKLNEMQANLEAALVKAGMNATVAKGVAANMGGLTAAGLGAAVGGATGAGVGLAVDANNRQLHYDEKQSIAAKANGDKKTEERLTKAACYEVKCWAQFPEGSPLYKQYFVSDTEVASLGSELAWVREQKSNGSFIYTPFQRFTDGVAATTGLSTVNGKGTLNGKYISKPNKDFNTIFCVTAECAAGMEPFRGNNPPDYISVQGNIYVASGGFAINLHDGSVFVGGSLGRTYPAFYVTPGFGLTAGRILGAAGASDTNAFLGGGGAQGNAFYPISPVIPIGIGGGVNHSYGGKTAVEIGIGSPGASVAPASYSKAIK